MSEITQTHDRYDFHHDPNYQARVKANYERIQAGYEADSDESSMVGNKLKLVAVGATVGVLAVSALMFGKDTLGERFGSLFPDDSAPITSSHQLEQNSQHNHGSLTSIQPK